MKHFRSSLLRHALVISMLSMGLLSSAYGSDPIAKPFDPLRIVSQEKLVKNIRSFWKILKEIPFDLYRCTGLLSENGWTGATLRRHPQLAPALEELYDFRLKEPSKFESLCFLNRGSDFEGVSVNDYGLCAGVTTMNWIANYLSLYDESGKAFRKFHPEFRLPEKETNKTFATLLKKKELEYLEYLKKEPYPQTKIILDEDEKKILRFYAPIIDRLFREKKPTVIPFFPDMNSFSAHPAIRAYLAKMTVETWYDVNVSLSSIYEILFVAGRKGKKIRAFEVDHLDRQVRAYLSEKIQPIIFIYLPPLARDDKRVHVLRVLSSEWANDGDQLVIRVVDPNFEPNQNIWEIKFDGYKKSPENVFAVYAPYGSVQVGSDGKPMGLTDVEIAPFFDRLSVETLQSWKTFLEKDGDAILNRLSATSKKKTP